MPARRVAQVKNARFGSHVCVVIPVEIWWVKGEMNKRTREQETEDLHDGQRKLFVWTTVSENWGCQGGKMDSDRYRRLKFNSRHLPVLWGACGVFGFRRVDLPQPPAGCTRSDTQIILPHSGVFGVVWSGTEIALQLS